MGNFYVNLSVKSTDREALVSALPSGDPGVVGPVEDGWTVLSSEALERQDPQVIERYGVKLSSELGVPVVGALNHDDDILQLYLFENGERTGFVDTDPGGLSGEDLPPRLENLDAFAALEGRIGVERLREGLLADVVFEFERHQQLTWPLGLPGYSAGFSYGDLSGFIFFD